MRIIVLLLMAAALHASPTLQSWMARFPETKDTVETDDQHLSYLFFFRIRDFDVCVSMTAKVDPKVLDPRRYAEVVYEGALADTNLVVHIRSARGVGRFRLKSTADEFLGLLNLIATHELFGLGSATQPEFEPRPATLDSYTIALVRKLGSQKTVIERFAGASEPVDDFVVKLWDLVCKKIHLLPEATQKKIGLITDKS